jgi:hypothetical protein
VAALVYIAAFAPDKGESVGTPIGGFPADGPQPPILPPRDGFLLLDQGKFAASFAADVPAEEAAFMADSQIPWGTEAVGGQITEPAWRTKPSWYLVTTEDRMIPRQPSASCPNGPAQRRLRWRAVTPSTCHNQPRWPPSFTRPLGPSAPGSRRLRLVSLAVAARGMARAVTLSAQLKSGRSGPDQGLSPTSRHDSGRLRSRESRHRENSGLNDVKDGRWDLSEGPWAVSDVSFVSFSPSPRQARLMV